MISETKLHTLSIRFECRMLRVISLMLAQFERLLLETDITVGVARRVLEKRHDLKNRAFNDLKKIWNQNASKRWGWHTLASICRASANASVAGRGHYAAPAHEITAACQRFAPSANDSPTILCAPCTRFVPAALTVSSQRLL
jgi:hypothetical protein